MSVGDIIDDICERSGMSCYSLAKLIGVSHVTVYRWARYNRDTSNPDPLPLVILGFIQTALDRGGRALTDRMLDTLKKKSRAHAWLMMLQEVTADADLHQKQLGF